MSEDVLHKIFTRYSSLPEKKKDAGCRGSAAKLTQKFSDALRKPLADVGDELLPAFENFLEDDYWSQKGSPILAFAKQYQRFLPGSEPAEKPFHKPSSPDSRPLQAKFNQVDAHQIDVFSPQTGCHAVRRKQEALDILSACQSPLSGSCLRQIGKKLTLEDYPMVEEWHAKAMAEYRVKFGREYVVVTERVA